MPLNINKNSRFLTITERNSLVVYNSDVIASSFVKRASDGCNDTLVELEIGEGVTTIEAEAFKNCIALMRIVLPSSLTFIGRNAFTGCTALNSVTVHSSLQYIVYDGKTTSTNHLTAADLTSGEELNLHYD